MYVAIGSIIIKEGYKEQFVNELVEVASASVKEEPGCMRLDIVQDGAEPDRVWLYEVFQDRDSYLAHGQQPHFVKFRDATKDWRGEGERRAAGPGSSSIWPPDDGWGKAL